MRGKRSNQETTDQRRRARSSSPLNSHHSLLSDTIHIRLPAHITKQELMRFVHSHHLPVLECRVRRDKMPTYAYAFLQCETVADAQSILERWGESGWQLPGLEETLHLRMAYSREEKERREEYDTGPEWQCPHCASILSGVMQEICPACRSVTVQVPHQNTGEQDVSPYQSPCLLVRGLHPKTSERILFMALLKRGKKQPQRAYLIKDRTSRTSWGFGFVQYDSYQTACEVMLSLLGDQPTSGQAEIELNGRRVSIVFGRDLSQLPQLQGIPIYWDALGSAVPFPLNEAVPELSNDEEIEKLISQTFEDGDNETLNKAAAIAPIQEASSASAPSIPLVNKRMQHQLQKWRTKHEELAESGILDEIPSGNATADLSRVCVLCKRQFKSSEDLERHVQLSKLHQYYLQQKKESHRPRVQYRPLKPVNSSALAAAKLSAKLLAAREQEPEHETTQVESHVGHRMLKQMGWQTGTGLGKDASGRVEPILPVSRPSGLGLGASHSSS